MQGNTQTEQRLSPIEKIFTADYVHIADFNTKS